MLFNHKKHLFVGFFSLEWEKKKEAPSGDGTSFK